MSKHENENMPESEQALDQAQHERLCAYVFGELQGAERVAFEAELLRSPALQRERERLVATIGLVKKAVPDEGLSTAVRRDIVASARRSRFRFLRGRTLVRVAAAAVVLLGGAFAVRMFTGGGSRMMDDVKVASVPESQRGLVAHDLAVDARASVEEDRLKKLGYGGDEGQATAPSAAAASPEVAEKVRALAYGGSGDAPAAAAAPASTEPVYEFAVLDRNSMPDASSYLARSENKEKDGGNAGEALALGATSISLGQGGHYGTGTPSAFVSRRAGSAGGRGGVAGRALKSEPGTAQQPSSPATGGAYRGPGDSRTPARETLARELASFEAEPTAPPAEPRAELRVVAGQLQDLAYAGEGNAQEDRKDETSFQTRREPVRTREQVAVQVEQLLDATRVAPGESASAMFFRYWGDSPFQPAAEQALSTFAVDVDTASYALTRAYLNRGALPPREAVRTEEFVNYFKADQAPPTDGKPFAIGLELAPSPFAKDARTEMLRVTVRGRDVQDFERQPIALTIVIDNSGSMNEGGRLELVKRALALLLRQLGSADSVAVVKFSSEASLVASMLPASRRGELEDAIRALVTEGGTNVEAGLRKGYELALASLARNAVNRVVLCSDGVGNIGETTAKGLLELVKDARAKGIYLNTVGVGMGNHDDAFLEELADKGDGVCNYVDSDAEAKRVFVDGLASLVQPIARDVKIQVELDPTQVESWRLLGYENRALRAQDFRNDAIDAGEVNAGHQVTALYELMRLPSRSGPLAIVRVRYKPPFAIDQGKEGERARAEAEQALEVERTLASSAVLPGFASATNGFQRAVLVAQFAEVLRQSVHARGDSFARLLEDSQRLDKALGDPDFTEFAALLKRANPLLDARSKQETPRVQQALDELSKLHYEQALRERKRELARQAGEPEPSSDEKEAGERADREAHDAIQRLEDEVRAELMRTSGVESLSPEALDELRDLGYAGDKKK